MEAYGELIQVINKIGLSLCNDLKLKRKLQKECSNSKKFRICSFNKPFKEKII